MTNDLLLNEIWVRLFVGLVLGLILGSFTTMLSYRVPRRLSIIHPPSHCTHCHTPLRPRDLIPVFSWLIEGGKCSHCGALISVRYLIIELITTAGCTAAFLFIGFRPAVIAALIGVVALITLVTINIERNQQN